MDPYLIDWLNLAGRWLHMIVGIAWIGASFYFVWLDNHLRPPARAEDVDKGVGGEVWSVHGGGFYHAQKYRVAPEALPDTLHWFKWEAYSTWISGMFLLILMYWVGAEVYTIDPTVADIGKASAVAIGMITLLAGWLVYDGLCRSPLGNHDTLLAALMLVLLSITAYGLCQVFSGRAAYIHFGAMLGTIMVANVFFVIIPGQRELVTAKEQGREPNPTSGLKGRQRSVHNTYFTLPVLFTMISNHYAITYNHPHNWLILIAISLAGALIRVYFVARHHDRNPLAPLVTAAVLLVGVFTAIAPRPAPLPKAAGPVDFARVQGIVHARCAGCHAAVPSQPGFAAPPKGVMLDTPERILAQAALIHQQSVVNRAMPLGNLTGITEQERAVLDHWYRAVMR